MELSNPYSLQFKKSIKTQYRNVSVCVGVSVCVFAGRRGLQLFIYLKTSNLTKDLTST